MEPFIVLKNVTKRYIDKGMERAVLANVSLDIRKGEMVAISGASGAGKTTLLNILGGIDSLTEGNYYYENLNISKLDGEGRKSFRREHVSFIFQNFALMERFSVYENVELPLIIKRTEKKAREDLVYDALKKVGMEGFALRFPQALSGGEKQRCAIARALVSNAPLILADEPTGSLDKENAHSIMMLLSDLNKVGKTIVLVTHDEHVQSCFDRIINIEDGQLKEMK